MSLRVGTFIITPSLLLLPLAAMFFVVLTAQRLPGRHRWGGLAAAIIVGAMGALLNGALGSQGQPETLHTWLNLRFGSFGGYWGALAGAMLYAAVARQGILRFGDALMPGLLAGGAIARLGCLFTGCCRGIQVAWPVLHGLQPFRLWPFYDLAALLLALGLVLRLELVENGRPAGWKLGLGLCSYGVLRFGLEFVRDLEPSLGPLTMGQVMALVQAAIGAGVLWGLRGARGKKARAEST